MVKVIQIRDIPDEVHRKLATRAAELGLSMAAYLRQELIAVADRRTVAEILSDWSGTRPDVTSADVIEAATQDRR